VKKDSSEKYPQAGKTTERLTPCRNSECEGDIVKTIEVSYPNPEGRMGGPRLSPHYAYSAHCNTCGIIYDVDIVERSIKK